MDVSAAATVKTKTAINWPTRSSNKTEFNIKLKFTANKQSSKEKSISKIFLLFSIMPRRLIKNIEFFMTII